VVTHIFAAFCAELVLISMKQPIANIEKSRSGIGPFGRYTIFSGAGMTFMAMGMQPGYTYPWAQPPPPSTQPPLWNSGSIVNSPSFYP
jgi:hypothetical protein